MFIGFHWNSELTPVCIFRECGRMVDTAKMADPTTPHIAGMWHQQSLFRLLNGHLFQSCFRKLRVIFAKERLRCVSEEAVTSLAADL
jgi:hypothetical protein